MPVRPLPSSPSLIHLKHQAKDLLKGHGEHDPRAAQQIREFHPRFMHAIDADVFTAEFRLSDAQLAVAREHGLPSWAQLKRQIEKTTSSDQMELPHHERIDDAIFRRAVDLVDTGDSSGLRSLLKQYPRLTYQRIIFHGGNYFRNPTLLEFIAENPVRHGKLPKDIVQTAMVIIDAGADQSSIEGTLGLVSTGRVSRECCVQVPLIDLLCDRGADPNGAIKAASAHGEFDAVEAMIRRGARINLPVAAALGRIEEFNRLFLRASSDDRHLALAMASQFGHIDIVNLLLDAGEDPNRYNPVGAHSHSTPLHQAAWQGHDELVRLLVERGAKLDLKDVLWHGTPGDWARHGGRTEIERYLRSQHTSA